MEKQRGTLGKIRGKLKPLKELRFSVSSLLGMAIGATLLALGASGLALPRPAEDLSWQEAQVGIARGIAQGLTGSLRRIEGLLGMIASEESLFLQAGQYALDGLRAREPSLAEVMVVSAEGEELLYSGSEEGVLESVDTPSEEEWYGLVMGGGVYRGLKRMCDCGEPRLLIAMPSMSWGYVAGAVNVGSLWASAIGSADPQSWSFLLADSSGQLLGQSPRSQTAGGEEWWGPAVSGEWTGEEEWHGVYQGRDGQSIASAAVTLGQYGWAVAVERPIENAYPSNALSIAALMLGALIGLVSLGLEVAAAWVGKTSAGEKVLTRLAAIGRPKEEPRTIERGERVKAESIIHEGEARASVLKRAREYEIAMSDLRKSQERYALAVQGANDGLWDWDLARDVIFFSPRWKAMIGHLESEIGTDAEEWLGRVHEDEREHLMLEIKAHLDGVDSHLDCEHRLLHRDGYYIWVRARGIAVRDETGSPIRMAGVMTDITDRKRNEEQWHYDALHDSLTGLANRSLFIDRVGHALDRARRTSQYKYAVLFLDLDQFKTVNDKYGHMIGDKLLIGVSQRLMTCLRDIDTIARLGGDEFVILLDDIEVLQDATMVSGRIHQVLKPVFELGVGQEIFTSTSIGIVLGAEHYEDAEQILRDADTALYRAKELGRACSAVFDEEMRTGTMKRIRVESDLRMALEKQDFELIYDPIVSCADLTIRGLDALVQWTDTESGQKKCGNYSNISDDARLLMHIGEWAVEEACRQRMRWRTALAGSSNSLFVGVGLSAAQLRNPELERFLRRVARDWPTDARSLAFEIHASTIEDDREVVKTRIEKMRAIGYQLHLTGTRRDLPAGAFLRAIPFDAVKIGGWYIDRLVGDNGRSGELRKIIRDAHRLGTIVIAEGVDTETHFVQVKELGCDFFKGAFVLQKLSSREVEEMLKESIV